jgi:predicted HD superfamily hydrolase involved in NAD metabolism
MAGIAADTARACCIDSVFSEERYRMMKCLLKERVGRKRYKHSKGVAKTAARLARIYGYDPAQARMAGILHDWDKALTFDEVRERVRAFRLDIDPVVVSDMPWLLHGPTAAAALQRLYPEFGGDVFQAIARHTSGAVDMAPLDCIIYIADIIEPHRTYGNMQGIEELQAAVGEVPLEELYFKAFKYTFQFLVDKDRQLFPETVAIWNALMWKYGKAKELQL